MADAQLIFNTPMRQWSLQANDKLWLIESVTHAMTFASFIDIQYVDNDNHNEIGLPVGNASLDGISSSGCRVNLKPYGPKEEAHTLTLQSETPDFSYVKVQHGLFDDGWAEPNLEFALENVQTVGFSVYLPPSDISTDKDVEIMLDDKAVKTFTMKRGEKQEIWVENSPLASAHTKLTLNSGYKEINSNDQRDLAFLIDQINVNGSGWISPSEAL